MPRGSQGAASSHAGGVSTVPQHDLMQHPARLPTIDGRRLHHQHDVPQCEDGREQGVPHRTAAPHRRAAEHRARVAATPSGDGAETETGETEEEAVGPCC